MNETNVYNLIVNEDFRRMSPLLPREKYTDMEHEIVYRGCKTPIIVWKKSIIDGFTQYEICHHWNVPFKIEEHDFKSRDEAILFICRKTLQYKNLIDEQYRYCIGCLYTAQKAYMDNLYPRQNQYTPPELRRPGYNTSSRNNNSQLVATEFSIAIGTVSKYRIYSKAVNKIAEKVPRIATEILSGEFHISHDNTIKLSEMAANEIQVIYNHAVNDGDTRLLHSAIQRTLSLGKARVHLEKKQNAQQKPEIKQMPKYDPDAEISSLTLTIPTWISSMKRTQSIANFNQVSMQALWKLEKKLNLLQDSIDILQSEIKEKYHE